MAVAGQPAPTLTETQHLASATWPVPPLACCSVIAKEIHVKPTGFLSSFQPAEHRPLARTHSFIPAILYISAVTDDSEEWACEDETLSLFNESQ